jgi:hypothetical protein
MGSMMGVHGSEKNGKLAEDKTAENSDAASKGAGT